MGRSLYGMLRRRYGRRPTGAERARHARAFHERLRSLLPLGVLNAKPRAAAAKANIAIIGAGFAGCMAANILAVNFGFNVTLYDPNVPTGGFGLAGGRVNSATDIVSGRILERGAELIGLNHPLWIFLADAFGYALGVVTPDDDYAGALLQEPLILHGQQVDGEAIYDAMTPVFNGWISASSVVTNPLAPWTANNAATLDSMNLGAQIPSSTSELVSYAIGLEWELNNTVAIGDQSWLANLAQFAAGNTSLSDDDFNFFDYTEVFRCTAGNQQLATQLLVNPNGPDVSVVNEAITAIDTSNGVTLTFGGGGTSPTFDYAIVATSVDVWSNITVDGNAFPYSPVQYGPAMKYLAPVASRFWIEQMLAPSSMADTLGMTWEGTDNQAGLTNIDLTVFAGGSLAQAAIDANDKDQYFAPLISAIYPGFSTPGGTFANDGASVLMGYSCPAPNQVVNQQQSYTTPYNNCLIVAGEHTSPAWFGFMEGALESGLAAAMRLASIASANIDPDWGGTGGL